MQDVARPSLLSSCDPSVFVMKDRNGNDNDITRRHRHHHPVMGVEEGGVKRDTGVKS